MAGGIAPTPGVAAVAPLASSAQSSPQPADAPGPTIARPERASGVFAPITSLPSAHGMGDMGPGSRAFVDALVDGGQHLWLLPPTTLPGDPSNSPYSSHSPFAINRWLISPDDLVADGLLEPGDITAARDAEWHPTRVDYGAAQGWKGPLIDRATDNLLAQLEHDPALRAEFAAFERRAAEWLPDYQAFMHLKQTHAQGEHPLWSRAEWPVEDRRAATARVPSEPTHAMRRIAAEQFIADRQHTRLRQYAAERGVALGSDIPFYEGDDGVGPWKRPELFQLDEAGKVLFVGGAAADPSFPHEQAWGMPGYETARKDELAELFRAKLGQEARRVGPGGYVRLDHLLGATEPYTVFVGVGPQPAGGGYNELFTAAEWKALLDEHPDVHFFGEDLGSWTPRRDEFMRELDPPRMRVGLQGLLEAPGDYMSSPHWADRVEPKDVMFSGTHDFPFVRSYLADHWNSGDVEHLRGELVRRGLASDPNSLADVARGYMQLNHDSAASLSVLQVFDVLGMGGAEGVLDGHLRAFNAPGTAGGENWATRIPASVLERGPSRDAFVGALRELTEHAGRFLRL